MARGKRSKAATKGLKPKRITSKQRAARRVNIEVARRAKKHSGGTGGGGKAMVKKNLPKTSKAYGGYDKKSILKQLGKRQATKANIGKAVRELNYDAGTSSLYKFSRKDIEAGLGRKVKVKNIPLAARMYWEKIGGKGSYIKGAR